MRSVAEYLNTDRTYDPTLKTNKQALNLLRKSIDLSETINIALDELYKGNRDSILFSTDCCYITVCKRQPGESGMMNELEFKHQLFHKIEKPWEECDYASGSKKIFTKDNPPELIAYRAIEIHSLRNKVNIPTHRPIFFTLKEQYCTDLILERIDIFVYFNFPRFIEMMRECKLPFHFLDKKVASSLFSTRALELGATYNNQYLVIGNNKSNFLIGWGNIFGIIYELEAGFSAISHMKDFLLESSYPAAYSFMFKISSFYNKIKNKIF